ncbi:MULTISPECIES: recombinase family protein [Bacilli]|uniref:recombinase family protein n=1 Tax=Bacilli TaxID=91061 RepID=UPI00203A59ED|nr:MULTISPECIES: recombinase family protein [Bacilli]MCM3032918.1 recombinase family protein [Niallia sp. MER 6]MDK8746866.1 recombinase family protein [Streptococcus agalactiae]
MIYGYARVSTYGQAKDGNSLKDQINILQGYNCNEIVEESFTGKTMDRPAFNELLKKLNSGDTLIVTKLDRFARTLIEGEKIVSELIEKGVKVIIDNMGMILDNTSSSKLMRQIFFAFAEYERNMIVERTQSGKAIAKLREDYREGRPNKFSRKQIKHALELLTTNSYKQVEEVTGISKSTLIRAKKKEYSKITEDDRELEPD